MTLSPKGEEYRARLTAAWRDVSIAAIIGNANQGGLHDLLSLMKDTQLTLGTIYEWDVVSLMICPPAASMPSARSAEAFRGFLALFLRSCFNAQATNSQAVPAPNVASRYYQEWRRHAPPISDEAAAYVFIGELFDGLARTDLTRLLGDVIWSSLSGYISPSDDNVRALESKSALTGSDLVMLGLSLAQKHTETDHGDKRSMQWLIQSWIGGDADPVGLERLVREWRWLSDDTRVPVAHTVDWRDASLYPENLVPLLSSAVDGDNESELLLREIAKGRFSLKVAPITVQVIGATNSGKSSFLCALGHELFDRDIRLESHAAEPAGHFSEFLHDHSKDWKNGVRSNTSRAWPDLTIRIPLHHEVSVEMRFVDTMGGDYKFQETKELKQRLSEAHVLLFLDVLESGGTVDNLSRWFQELASGDGLFARPISPHVPIAVVLNKCDLVCKERTSGVVTKAGRLFPNADVLDTLIQKYRSFDRSTADLVEDYLLESSRHPIHSSPCGQRIARIFEQRYGSFIGQLARKTSRLQVFLVSTRWLKGAPARAEQLSLGCTGVLQWTLEQVKVPFLKQLENRMIEQTRLLQGAKEYLTPIVARSQEETVGQAEKRFLGESKKGPLASRVESLKDIERKLDDALNKTKAFRKSVRELSEVPVN